VKTVRDPANSRMYDDVPALKCVDVTVLHRRFPGAATLSMVSPGSTCAELFCADRAASVQRPPPSSTLSSA